MSIKKLLIAAASAAAVTAAAASTSSADQIVLDLTHPIPTFAPTEGDPTTPDMSQPWGDPTIFPSFGAPAVLAISQFPTNQGHFDLGQLIISEHHGPHLDAASHFVNNDASMEDGGMPASERASTDELGASDLIGRVVLIDISGRVQSELDKNGGVPSPDTSVTNFSNDSNAVVTAADIDAVADQLDDGVWLVLNLGWSRFYFDPNPDFGTGPYINGFNHPGISKAAVDRLIEIMEERGIRIGGIIADNIGIDSGDSAIGDDDQWTNSWHAHVRLLQRGVMFVENAANLDQIASVGDASACTLIVGAPKHVRGTGGPSRILAICDS